MPGGPDPEVQKAVQCLLDYAKQGALDDELCFQIDGAIRRCSRRIDNNQLIKREIDAATPNALNRFPELGPLVDANAVNLKMRMQSYRPSSTPTQGSVPLCVSGLDGRSAAFPRPNTCERRWRDQCSTPEREHDLASPGMQLDDGEVFPAWVAEPRVEGAAVVCRAHTPQNEACSHREISRRSPQRASTSHGFRPSKVAESPHLIPPVRASTSHSQSRNRGSKPQAPPKSAQGFRPVRGMRPWVHAPAQTKVKRGAAFECGGSLRGSQCTEGEPQIRRTKAVPRGLKQLADNKITALHRRLKRRCRTAGELFFAGDTDRNDMLSFAEFCKGVAALGVRPPPSEEELELIFSMYDTSRDGFIQWEEFTREDDIATNRGVDQKRRWCYTTNASKTQKQINRSVDSAWKYQGENGRRAEIKRLQRAKCKMDQRLVTMQPSRKPSEVTSIVESEVEDVDMRTRVVVEEDEIVVMQAGQVQSRVCPAKVKEIIAASDPVNRCNDPFWTSMRQADATRSLAETFGTNNLRELWNIFRLLDADGSGDLSFDELIEFLKSKGMEFSDRVMKEFEYELGFNTKDADSTNEMRFTEFIRFMKKPRAIDDDIKCSIVFEQKENYFFQGESETEPKLEEDKPKRWYNVAEGKWQDVPDPRDPNPRKKSLM